MGKVSIKKNVKKPIIKKPRKTPAKKPKLTTQTQTQNVVVNVGKDGIKKRKTPIKKGITTKKQEATKKAEEAKKPSIVNTNIQPQQPKQPMNEVLKDKVEEKAKSEKVKNNELEKDKVKEKEEEDETIFYDAKDEPKPITIKDIRPSDVKVSDLLKIVNPISSNKGPVEKVIGATFDYFTKPNIITPQNLNTLVNEADLTGENPTTNTIKLKSPLTKEDLIRNQILTGNLPNSSQFVQSTLNYQPLTMSRNSNNFFDAPSVGPILPTTPSPVGPIPTPADLPPLSFTDAFSSPSTIPTPPTPVFTTTPTDNPDDDEDIFLDAEDELLPVLPVNLTPTQNNDIQTQPIQTATITTQENIPIATAVSVPQVTEPLQITQDPFNPPLFNPFNETLPAIYLSSSFEEKLKQRRKEKENEKPLAITYETPSIPQTLVKKEPQDLGQFIDPKIKEQSLKGVGAFISGKPKETKQETKLSNLLNKPKAEEPISQSKISPAQKIKDLNTKKMVAIQKNNKLYTNTDLAKILITNGITKGPDGQNITTPKSGPMTGSNRINRDSLSKLLLDAVNEDKINFSLIEDKIKFNELTLED